MRLALAITLLASTLFAQPGPGLPYYAGGTMAQNPCTGGNGYPTNIPGYPAYSWYIACGSYGTNAGVGTWSNLTSNAGLNLTNGSGSIGSSPSQGPSLNGLATLAFVNGTVNYLRGGGWTLASSSQFELFMVAAITNQSSMTVFGDGDDSGIGLDGIQLLTGSANGAFLLYAGSSVGACNQTGLTNQWAIYDVIFNGASSTIYTNNVQGATVNPGTDGLVSGFEIPTHYGAGAVMSVAELLTYKTNLVTVGRSNVWWTLKTRYGL